MMWSLPSTRSVLFLRRTTERKISLCLSSSYSSWSRSDTTTSLLRHQHQHQGSEASSLLVPAAAATPYGRHYSSRSRHQDDDDDYGGGGGGGSGEGGIALVIGSSGVLGSTLSRYLSREMGMTVIGADVVEYPNNDFNTSDWELDGFVTLPTMSQQQQQPSIADVTNQLAAGIHTILQEGSGGGNNEQQPLMIDTIICASGGWEGDPQPVVGTTLQDVQLGAKEYGETINRMMYMNLLPVIAAGYSAQTFMEEDGLFVVIGATAALASTPGMLGYGLSKAACHHIVQTLGSTTAKSLDTKVKKRAGRRNRKIGSNTGTMSVVGILPTTIDTPTNRQAMPNGDFETWTKPRDIAVEIGNWIDTPPLRPHSGALVKVTTNADGSIFDIAR